MSRKIITAVTALLIVTLFTSCNRRIGTGVLLWSADDSTLANGTIVNIYEESKIRHTYTIAPQGKKDKKNRVETDTWRVRFFDKEQDAKNYAKQYAPYITSFAYSDRQGLPIREAESVDSNRVYKLREGQEIKVLGRADKEVSLSDKLKGYWYHVLTEDGISGYVFDYYLTVFSLNDKGRVIENARDTSDPLLDNFLGSTWRPSYYNDMITKGMIDLSLFKDAYALKIDKDKKQITLNLPDKNITETYTDISKFGTKRYDFEGTSFQVTIVSDRVASVFYKYDGTEINEAYVKLDENVNDIVSAELKRRDSLLKDLMEHGTQFSSANYGSVNIIDDTGRFIWNDISRLVSRNIISGQSEPQGRIEFSCFPDSIIKNNYKGVITFSFRNGTDANFLYSYTDNGVSFIYVPDRYIKNRVVTTDQFFDPILIFFQFDKTSAVKPDDSNSTDNSNSSSTSSAGDS